MVRQQICRFLFLTAFCIYPNCDALALQRHQQSVALYENKLSTDSPKAEAGKSGDVLFVEDLRPSAIIGNQFPLNTTENYAKSVSSALLTTRLTNHFVQFGNVRKLSVLGVEDYHQCRQKRRRRPYAFVTFEEKESATLAIRDHEECKATSSRDGGTANQALFRRISYSSVPDTWRRKPVKPQDKIGDLSASIIDGFQSGTLKADIVLQVNKSHLHRVMDYVNKGLSMAHVATVTGYVEKTCSRTTSLIFIKIDSEKASVSSFVEESLAQDPFIYKGLNKVYAIDDSSMCLSEQEVCLEACGLLRELQLQNGSAPISVKVQTFPPQIQSQIVETMEHHQRQEDPSNRFEMAPSKHSHLLSVVRIDRIEGESMFLWSLKPTWDANIEDIQSSSLLGDTDVVSRAYFKLKEAIERSQSTVKKFQTMHHELKGSDEKSMVAIDCGAAPGGWTKYLALDFGCTTTYSVDPGRLDPTVEKLEGVVHVPLKALEAIEDFSKQGNICADIWVSDMCLHDMNGQIDIFKQAIEAGVVRRSALFCLTLKCTTGFSKGSYDKQVELASQNLEGIASDITTLHLFSNRKGERTIVGLVGN
ncbi:unnamed protein product [Cylindrotheca closterium]|uniref:RRM domain-containing protein n=1 Tax=Cylindrotheca closterium TaxID=2856 RepID=A0AAD2G7F2_9STRA|nr:unnamed protein product [Cylindrotheca closterium]